MRKASIAGLLLVLFAAPALADAGGSSCLKIEAVTAFAPRGEIYVRVTADCHPKDFEFEDSVLAYLEVLVGETVVLGDDVRVYADEPKARSTFSFRDLNLEPGDPVLVRLARFGEILDLTTLKVP